MRPIRVSFINYLNSLPLGWLLLRQQCPEPLEIFHSTPAECAEALRAGDCDVGLVPVIEYQRIPELCVLPDISIASKHAARSVLLVSRCPMPEIETVALDSSSRTSVALLKILLRRRVGRLPRFSTAPPELGRMLDQADAALIIGDPALQVDRSRNEVWDLGAEWRSLTGLPFVFAVWAVRAAVDLGAAVECFYRSKREGLQSLDQIAAMAAAERGMRADDVCEYLGNYLNYDLDSENLAGLELFFRYAQQDGLIEQVRSLQFYPCQAA